MIEQNENKEYMSSLGFYEIVFIRIKKYYSSQIIIGKLEYGYFLYFYSFHPWPLLNLSQ